MAESKLQPIRVRIKNFQSIEDISFTIHGLTVISGKTNIGKSAIMRSISSAMLGDPVIGLVRKGAQYCSVEILSDNWGFRWEKGEKGINRYIIGDTVYDKPGQKQLDEIIQMGFGSVKLGQKEIQPWWASQFFPIFLLGESGPAVTDFISEVSRLNVLQDAIALSVRGKKRANDEAKSKAEESQKLRDKLTRIDGTNQIVKVCKELEDQKNSVDEYQDRIITGEEFASKLLTSSKRVIDLTPAENVVIPEDGCKDTVNDLKSMHGHWKKLETSAKKIISLKPAEKAVIPELPVDEWQHLLDGKRFLSIDKLKSISSIFEQAKDVKSPTVPKAEDLLSIKTGEQIFSKIRLSERFISSLSKKVSIPEAPNEIDKLLHGQKLIDKLSTALIEEENLNNQAVAIEKELMEIAKELDTMPFCPACKRPVVHASHAENQHG